MSAYIDELGKVFVQRDMTMMMMMMMMMILKKEKYFLNLDLQIPKNRLTTMFAEVVKVMNHIGLWDAKLA